MKKYIITIILVALSSCSFNNESKTKDLLFNKQKECLGIYDGKDDLSFKNDYSGKGTFDLVNKQNVNEVLYSEVLNSCIFLYENLIREYKGDGINEYKGVSKIINLLTKEVIFHENFNKTYYLSSEINKDSGITNYEETVKKSIFEQGGNNKDFNEWLESYRSKGLEENIEYSKIEIEINESSDFSKLRNLTTLKLQELKN